MQLPLGVAELVLRPTCDLGPSFRPRSRGLPNHSGPLRIQTGLGQHRAEVFQMILANRFGRYYAPGGTKDVSGEVIVSGKTGHQRSHKKAAAR